jgi:hypothetical protein
MHEMFLLRQMRAFPTLVDAAEDDPGTGYLVAVVNTRLLLDIFDDSHSWVLEDYQQCCGVRRIKRGVCPVFAVYEMLVHEGFVDTR